MRGQAYSGQIARPALISPQNQSWNPRASSHSMRSPRQKIFLAFEFAGDADGLHEVVAYQANGKSLRGA